MGHNCPEGIFRNILQEKLELEEKRKWQLCFTALVRKFKPNEVINVSHDNIWTPGFEVRMFEDGTFFVELLSSIVCSKIVRMGKFLFWNYKKSPSENLTESEMFEALGEYLNYGAVRTFPLKNKSFID